MNWQISLFRVEPPESNPELVFDDQPVEYLIYRREESVEPSPADFFGWPKYLWE